MARETRLLHGATLLTTACAVFCVGGILVKAGHIMPAATLALGRFAVGLALLMAAAQAGWIRLRFVDRLRLFGRGLFGGLAIFITFLCIAKLGLGKGVILLFTYPVFAAVFSSVFLRERFGPTHAVALLIAGAGVYLIAADDVRGLGPMMVFGRYELLGLFGAVLSGAAVTLIRKLHDTDDVYAIYFAQCLVGLVLMAIPGTIGPVHLGLREIGIIVGVGITATAGQLLMTQGFKYVPVRIGSLLTMLDPAFAFVAGLLVFGEPATLRSILGACLIISACVSVVIGQRRPLRFARQIPE